MATDADFDKLIGMEVGPYEAKVIKDSTPDKREEFVPSPYQQAIFDWIRESEGHAIINAVAGSGKTTTLVQAIKHCYERTKGRILFLAFNKHIAEELGSRIPFGFGATCSTFNAFGWGICRENVPHVKLDKFKDDNILKKLIDPEHEKERYSRLKRPVLRMVSLLKSLNQGISTWRSAADLYGVEIGDLKPMDRFEEVLADVYRRSISEIRTMNFDDQVFQPIYRDWPVPSFSWVLMDESQDASPINIEMAMRLSVYGRMILVGDPDQSIYLFRGAHPDAMATLARDLRATELPLSVCYRCADAIIEAARKQVPRIEAPQPNPNGEGIVEWLSTEEFREEVRAADIVLCRTTAPLVKNCLKDISEGKRAFVKGRDVGDGLVAVIEQIHGNPERLKNDYRLLFERETDPGPYDVPAFLLQCNDFYIERAARLEAQGREAELMTLEGNIQTIHALAINCDWVVQIIKRVETIFEDGFDANAIMYMTGHKCKGLENETIFVLRPDLCPHPKAKSPEALRQEKNLLYVMKTRGKRNLFFVRKDKDEK